MEDDFITLLDRKLDEALSVIDLRVGDRFQAIYAQITPAPSCPFCSVIIKDIKGICADGVKERGHVAKDVVLTLLDTIQLPLTAELVEKILDCVQKRLPEDKFVVQAANVKGVYERRASGDGRFQERPYEIELSAIRCGSANLSRRSVGSIRTLLEERLLKCRVDAQLAEPEEVSQIPVSEQRKRAPWSRDNWLSLVSIGVAVAIAVVTIIAACYTQEIKAILRPLGR